MLSTNTVTPYAPLEDQRPGPLDTLPTDSASVVGGDSNGKGGVRISKEQTIAQRKLIQASLICLIFMIVEVIAGYVSNSLALLTDASHLLSDLSSFLISIFAIWVSAFPGTGQLSFGYHRAEILGALISVLLIWILTIFLVYEAVQRLGDPRPINGPLMFTTALLGTIANSFVTWILGVHSHGIGNVHAHQHGDGEDSHSHRHDIEHGQNSFAHSHGAEGYPQHTHQQSRDDLTPSNHEGLGRPIAKATSTGSHHHTHQHCHHPDRKSIVAARSYGECGHSHNEHQQVLPISTTTATGGSASAPQRLVPSGAADAHVRARSISETFSLRGKGTSTSPRTLAAPASSCSHSHGSGNVNLRAAYIHALGDLIQNIGVLMAAAIIWWRPTLVIVDPICTFVFSILVLLTTGEIIGEALNVLMEGSPSGVNIENLRADLLGLESVSEVHDLHVWSLSVGKPSCACHIVVDSEEKARKVLRMATNVVQNKHNILHTTIQIDFSANKVACDTDAHSHCL